MKLRTVYRNKKSSPVKAIKKEKYFNPAEYRGIYKNFKIVLENEIEKLREEWNRE